MHAPFDIADAAGFSAPGPLWGSYAWALILLTVNPGDEDEDEDDEDDDGKGGGNIDPDEDEGYDDEDDEDDDEDPLWADLCAPRPCCGATSRHPVRFAPRTRHTAGPV